MANRLAEETSPYLLQHRDNPVDWYPWGPEALNRAKELDRPILVSVGYSACHWCHVMERESFENEQTAAYMNEHFVNIKVDREERPDVDSLYMEAVQAMTGRGGWPMTVFCDPDGVPFYGGTYFPPDEGRGMPSFGMVMEACVATFETRRDELRDRAPTTQARLGAIGDLEPDEESPDDSLLTAAIAALLERADEINGGFGGAPKFPPVAAIELLLARGRPDTVELTLDAMMCGGIYDQIGGGFARYAVDAIWLIPHFEKMLYDNAQLAAAYLHGWQAIGHDRYRRICEETLDWMLRDLRGPEGGFYSALDADSEGVEGRFYAWTPDEIRSVLSEADAFSAEEIDGVLAHFGVSEQGNFEGSNVLHLPAGPDAPEPARLAAARSALLEARSRRVWPGLDDKRLTSWNALAIRVLAEAGAALDRPDYLEAARTCADFVLTELTDDEGRLLRTYKNGEARLNAYLEDHAYLLEALLSLYEASFEERWFERATALAETMIERFLDRERGGFYSTSDDHEKLIARRKEVGDHPIPSGNSSAALGLFRLGALSGEQRYEEAARTVLALFAQVAPRQPEAFAYMLLALDFDLSPTKQVALVGDDLAELATVARSRHRPHTVLAGGPAGTAEPALLRDRPLLDGKPTAYVCEHFTCLAPVTDARALDRLL